MRRVGDGLAAWVLVGVIGWAGILYIGWMLWQATPPKAGFDLALLLDAARRVLAGQSPYDPAMLAGNSPLATELFYSYPPPVAQAMTALAWLPNGLVLVLWAVGATAGLGAATAIMARLNRHDPWAMAVRTVAVAPLLLPFAVSILFGNLDAWYPLAFGLLLVAALPGTSRRQQVAGGIAIGAVCVAKLHPASLLAWLAVRALLERGGASARVLGAAVATCLTIGFASLVVGGIGPWADYVAVLRVGAAAGVVDPRNMGPVSLLGQVVPLDRAGIVAAQAVVTLVALGVTVLAAARVRDSLLSLSVAIAASLVVLPVTWYHYPVALVPVGIVMLLRGRAGRGWIAASMVVADVAIGYGQLLWLAVVILLGACAKVDRPRIGPEDRTLAEPAP